MNTICITITAFIIAVFFSFVDIEYVGGSHSETDTSISNRYHISKIQKINYNDIISLLEHLSGHFHVNHEKEEKAHVTEFNFTSFKNLWLFGIKWTIIIIHLVLQVLPIIHYTHTP